MKVYHNMKEWREARSGSEYAGKRVGFVPTMGALHAGHRALLERARAENDLVVLSIFVNPTQFNSVNDLVCYPRTLDADLALADGLTDGLTDAVIVPTEKELYPDGYNYRVTEKALSKDLEGVHRPGHFDGVLTVVLKLLNLVQPQRAYFGEKDWQQLQLIRGLVDAFFLSCEIIPCPTVRDPDGLALSSRNQRLSAEARIKAAIFPQALRESADVETAAATLTAAGFTVDYVADHEGVRLGAAFLEGVRLIDNVRL